MSFGEDQVNLRSFPRRMNPDFRWLRLARWVTCALVAIAQHRDAVLAREPDQLDTSRSQLLTNTSFEQGATISDESSLPGWQFQFRQRTDQPALTAAEVVVIDDRAQSHSGRKFLRIMPRDREIILRSPKAKEFEPGLYEISAWLRGRPGTVGGMALDVLGANFGAGLSGLSEQWQKFSLVVYSKGVAAGEMKWPEQSQLFIAVFAPGQRGQIAEPVVDIDDVSVSRLRSGLADAFGDHMVLQRDRVVPIRGWAKDAGQKVTIAFNGQTRTAVADKDGWWEVSLEPMKAGGPFILSVDGRPASYDVMVGDVWICSGQSNMEFGVDKLHGEFKTAPEIIAKANHPQLRLWQAPKQFSPIPLRSYVQHQSAYPADYQAAWSVCTPTTVSRGVWGGFSAVGYYFGREIQADQKVAVGLMMIAHGGTQIESFISAEGLRGVPQEQWVVPPITKTANANLKNTPFPEVPPGVQGSAAYATLAAGHAKVNARQGTPDGKAFQFATSAYNGLISPIFPFAVRGVLWYQGEHNGNDPHYEPKLKALIADWRTRFAQPELPFIIAQLPYWKTAERMRWQLVREAQQRVAQTEPGTALAVTIDLHDKEGDGYGMGEIHPKNKLEVARRMALAARTIAYGEKVVSSGPVFRAMKSEDGRLRLQFDSIGGGLEARGGGKVIGFQVAGSDRKFVNADAVIGEGENDILVITEKGFVPVAVRYGFSQAVLPTPNLINKEGLPASPFRTDDWPVE